jgi:hypothetical protein
LEGREDKIQIKQNQIIVGRECERIFSLSTVVKGAYFDRAFFRREIWCPLVTHFNRLSAFSFI